jgi:hypothetical protein
MSGTAGPVLFQSARQIIGGSGSVIVPDCVVEEIGRDDVQITEHPVEQGASITDHAFKKPREVTLRWSWTNAGRSDTFVQEIYAVLLALQDSLAPFTIYTGKSTYSSMLLASLSQTTNNAQENSLAVVAVCKEIIIVSTQTVSIAPQSAQAVPGTTSPSINTGNVQPSSKPAGFGGGITPTTNFP